MTRPMRYRKKPVTIEAVRLTKDNGLEIQEWAEKYGTRIVIGDYGLYAVSLEGTMKAEFGDWIVKGINGEFSRCKADIFDATYEEATE